MPKLKKCRVCREAFLPRTSLQVLCGNYECACLYAHAAKTKREVLERTKERKVIREAKQKLKTRQQWLKEAQIEFNRYIRARDSAEPCISCGNYHNGQYHAGHFRSIGSAPELRFEESNVHKQCSPCNNYKSGNLLEYRKRLILKIGAENVEWLEGKHEPKKYTIDDLKELKIYYKNKLKEIQNG